MKNTQIHHWTLKEIDFLRSHPEMSNREIAQELGTRSVGAVRHKRAKVGRYVRPGSIRGLCIVCDARVVWEESSQAKSLRLCKGCYLKEVKMREEEDAEANAYRQRKFKSLRRKGVRNAEGNEDPGISD